MAFFYEIRGADNSVLKRDGGFATQDAAKTAARDDAKKMKKLRQPAGGVAFETVLKFRGFDFCLCLRFSSRGQCESSQC
jgi:hypothetical protein